MNYKNNETKKKKFCGATLEKNRSDDVKFSMEKKKLLRILF